VTVFEELKHLISASGLPVKRIARESRVGRETIDRWLDGETSAPRIDTMLKVATVVGKQIELTGAVRKMVGYYPPPKPRLKLWKIRVLR
jgi:DNA-binding phage protein